MSLLLTVAVLTLVVRGVWAHPHGTYRALHTVRRWAPWRRHWLAR